MPASSFVHLHCHSHYSLLDGANRIPELVAHAKQLGMNALALTDHGNLYGAIEFYRECRAAGLNPILGYEAYVAAGRRTEREARRRGEAAYHLTLLAYNRTGFRNLIRMASSAFLEGYHYVPRVDKELLETHHEGLVCLSGCASGEFSELILKSQLDEACQLAHWFHTVFGRHFYIEIQNNGLEIQAQCAAGAIDVANRLGIPLVATSDAHYLCQKDSAAHDVLLCINTGKMREDTNRLRYGSDQFYVRPPEEMYRLFPAHHDAVRRSQEIADGCEIELDFNARHFPVFTPPRGQSAEEFLGELCWAGLRECYGDPSPADPTARLQHELDVICRMGFASYFLIVWDFVRFARERGIAASARGSACGAVVTYVLKLSHVDPLEYGLLFERFLDPNRGEAPDIDIDFCQEGRDEVIAYVRRKYGDDSVAQIATFGTLAARAAVKDVGRVLNIPLARVTQITEMIPKTLGITLDDALRLNGDLRQEVESDPQIRELLDIARRLEGTNRNAGTHAAGVVISNGPLVEHVPLHRVMRKGESEARGRSGGEAIIATQWGMGDLEKIGLLKMDFLGLRTLTLLSNALRLIEETRGLRIDLRRLPLDDLATYALLQRGDAGGIFQFESEGIRDLLRRMRPDSIRDIIACTALYRPGPLGGGMVDAYINRKHGRERPAYQHPVMQEVLAETHGVMVYQEQVMCILNRLGGIDLSSAYACIKAISKKKQEVIDQRRAEFLAGAGERGVLDQTAREIFDLITYFGGYGFTKSHSAAYALVSYQTAYLKAHYPPEFLAALLSSEIDDGNKRDSLVEHIEDARRLGYTVQAPDVNSGGADFTVAQGKLLFGLTAIKGVGRAAAGEIVRVRAEVPYKDLFDFCERVDLKLVNRAAIERLIKAGAFDRVGARRSQMMQALASAFQAGGEVQLDRRQGQRNFFESLSAAGPPTAAALPDVPEWSDAEKLKYEKEALDFYFSSHPLAQHDTTLRRYSTHTVQQVSGLPADQQVVIGGMITQVRFQNAKRARNGNSRYARCKLEDLTGSVECVMWPDDFARHKEEMREDHVCFVQGFVERTREDPGLVLGRILSLDQGCRELTRALALALVLPDHGEPHLDAVVELLRRAPGRCPVYLFVRDAGGHQARLKFGDELGVNPANLAVSDLQTLLGPERVLFSGTANGRNGGS